MSLSAPADWPGPSQAVSSSVPRIHSQVPTARSPFLRFRAFLSSYGSVRKRSRRHSLASGFVAKASSGLSAGLCGDGEWTYVVYRR